MTERQYNSLTKRQWRAWGWNQIESRINVPTREAIGIYLPAENNNDEEQYSRRGFISENIFGVEARNKVVEKCRINGVNTIPGSLAEVVMRWKSPELDFIFADLMCGFDKRAFGLSHAIIHSMGVKRGACVVVNLMRGHDAFAMPFKRDLNRPSLKLISPKLASAVSEGHRGAMWFMSLIGTLSERISCGALDCPIDPRRMLLESLNRSKFELNSYPSRDSGDANITFDSVAFTWPWKTTLPEELSIDASINRSPEYFYTSWMGKGIRSCVDGRIRAAKAVRTLKLNSLAAKL